VGTFYTCTWCSHATLSAWMRACTPEAFLCRSGTLIQSGFRLRWDLVQFESQPALDMHRSRIVNSMREAYPLLTAGHTYVGRPSLRLYTHDVLKYATYLGTPSFHGSNTLYRDAGHFAPFIWGLRTPLTYIMQLRQDTSVPRFIQSGLETRPEACSGSHA